MNARAMFRDLSMMTKPRIAVMVLLTTLVGYILGAEGPVEHAPLWCSLAGVLLVAASSSVLNQVMEREFDARMERTRQRPLPAGRIRPAPAVALGLVLAVVGVLLLVTMSNLLTTLLALGTLLAYLFVYTPLKRLTALNTIVGAVPGAMPPVLGWTAASGELAPGAAVLFAILFLWQLPHFLSIAWMYREDYRRGGYRMLPLYDGDGTLTARQMVLHCVVLCLLTFLPYGFQLGGGASLVVGVCFGVLFLVTALVFQGNRTRRNARIVMAASLLYLPAVFGPLALGL